MTRPRFLLSAVLALAVFTACDRNLEPFDPDETSRAPDMAHIFPEGAQEGPGLRAPRPAPPRVPNSRGNRPAPQANGEAAGGPVIRVRVSLDPALEGKVPGDAVLFVIARKAGAAGGPPLAVVRTPGPAFPAEFDIGQANVMIPGLRFEGPLDLTARLDADGNAMTRMAGDFGGALAEPVEPGAEVEIVLDQRL